MKNVSIFIISIIFLSGCNCSSNNKSLSISPIQAIEKSSESAPRAIEGVFELTVKSSDSKHRLEFLNSELENQDQRNLISLICLDKHQLHSSQHRQTIITLRKLGQQVLLITPTLDNYDIDIIHQASAHLVKPITRERFYNALCTLTLEQYQKQTVLKKLTGIKKNTFEGQLAPILIVDDNEINLMLIQSILNSLGIEADTANDGFEALKLCKTKFYPLIFMDILMPGIDGTSCMKKIRHLSKDINNAAIIALTAYALPDEKEAFLKQGFQALMTKPIDEDKLISTLTQFLPNYKSADNLPEQTKDAHSKEINDPVRTDYSSKSVIDFYDGIHRCNGNKELACSFLNKFLDALPNEKKQIESLLIKKDFVRLEACIHKLHGACHYCGVPALREATKQAEHQLKTKHSRPESTINILISEIDRVLQWHASHPET